MAMTEDLSAFFDADEFAVAAQLDSVASGAVIFDRDYLREVGMVSGSEPVAVAIASEYPASAVGKVLTIGGVNYTIRDRESMADGALVVLKLEA